MIDRRLVFHTTSFSFLDIFSTWFMLDPVFLNFSHGEHFKSRTFCAVDVKSYPFLQVLMFTVKYVSRPTRRFTCSTETSRVFYPSSKPIWIGSTTSTPSRKRKRTRISPIKENTQSNTGGRYGMYVLLCLFFQPRRFWMGGNCSNKCANRYVHWRNRVQQQVHVFYDESGKLVHWN